MLDIGSGSFNYLDSECKPITVWYYNPFELSSSSSILFVLHGNQRKAIAQGDHRFSRGQTFYQSAMLSASKLNTPFRWKLQTVPNVGHNNQDMAQAAINLLSE